MNSTIYGPAFSKETIDSQTLPVVSRDLLPWLLKDRKEALEGSMAKSQNKKGEIRMVHDGFGLDKAEKSLRQAEAGLAENPADPKVVKFLNEQVAMAKGKVGFYEGKIYLLDKVIAGIQ